MTGKTELTFDARLDSRLIDALDKYYIFVKRADKEVFNLSRSIRDKFLNVDKYKLKSLLQSEEKLLIQKKFDSLPVLNRLFTNFSSFEEEERLCVMFPSEIYSVIDETYVGLTKLVSEIIFAPHLHRSLIMNNILEFILGKDWKQKSNMCAELVNNSRTDCPTKMEKLREYHHLINVININTPVQITYKDRCNIIYAVDEIENKNSKWIYD